MMMMTILLFSFLRERCPLRHRLRRLCEGGRDVRRRIDGGEREAERQKRGGKVKRRKKMRKHAQKREKLVARGMEVDYASLVT